jgi:hypothetical protein
MLSIDPNITPPNELFPWIPVGLITDLIDNNPDVSNVIDNVFGFTYLEIETALKTKPANMSDYKAALKSIKPGQSTAIDQLFTSYGY